MKKEVTVAESSQWANGGINRLEQEPMKGQQVARLLSQQEKEAGPHRQVRCGKYTAGTANDRVV